MLDGETRLPTGDRSICVIFNPHAGRRRARRRLRRFLQEWEKRVALWPTEFAGHGVELGRRAAEEGFSTIVAAGGDGTAHDVANGVLSVESCDATFAVVPIGSANDYAYSFQRQFGTSRLDDESRFPVDVGLLKSPSGTSRFFIEAAGFGLNGHVTLESRQIKSLQGPLLYGLAAWRAMRHYQVGDVRIACDDQPPISRPTMLLSVMIGLREGSFIMSPEADMQDGMFDVVHARPMGPLAVARMLPRLYFRGPPADHPAVTTTRCQRLRIESAQPLTIHVDGEMFSTESDSMHEVEVAILPKRLNAKLCRPS